MLKEGTGANPLTGEDCGTEGRAQTPGPAPELTLIQGLPGHISFFVVVVVV